jgi:T5orf172 domain
MRDKEYIEYAESISASEADSHVDRGRHIRDGRGLPFQSPLAHAHGDHQSHAESGGGDRRKTKAGERENQSGFVYFLETHDGQFVKIGFSNSVARRFARISPLMPGLRVLGYMPGTRATEMWLHGRFAAHRERGEWFRTSDELRNFLTHGGLLQLPPEPPKRVKLPKPVEAVVIPEPKPEPKPEPPALSEQAEQMRQLGRLVGKTYGAKGAATTNAKLKPEERQANASKAGKASAAALTPEERSERARRAARKREEGKAKGKGKR